MFTIILQQFTADRHRSNVGTVVIATGNNIYLRESAWNCDRLTVLIQSVAFLPAHSYSQLHVIVKFWFSKKMKSLTRSHFPTAKCNQRNLIFFYFDESLELHSKTQQTSSIGTLFLSDVHGIKHSCPYNGKRQNVHREVLYRQFRGWILQSFWQQHWGWHAQTTLFVLLFRDSDSRLSG